MAVKPLRRESEITGGSVQNRKFCPQPPRMAFLAILKVISDSLSWSSSNVFCEEGFIGTTGRTYRSISQLSELPAEFDTSAERCNSPTQEMPRFTASLATLLRETCNDSREKKEIKLSEIRQLTPKRERCNALPCPLCNYLFSAAFLK
jgi:hypothetical protein